MNISKRSWHYRIVDYTFSGPPSSDICKYCKELFWCFGVWVVGLTIALVVTFIFIVYPLYYVVAGEVPFSDGDPTSDAFMISLIWIVNWLIAHNVARSKRDYLIRDTPPYLRKRDGEECYPWYFRNIFPLLGKGF